jgi:hypothetical protein
MRWAGFADGPHVVRALTGRLAVAIQLGDVVEERRRRRVATVEAALELDCQAGAPRARLEVLLTALRGLEAAMPGLWRIPLLNACKEPIWRLWVNGFARYGASAEEVHRESCPCSWRPHEFEGETPTAWRAHRFWGCPVAEGIVSCLAAALLPRVAVVGCRHVWLLQPPCKGVHAGVWAVIAAVAVAAMERGRRHLWRLAHTPERPAPADAVTRAAALAVADFWEMLSSFVAAGAMPRDWPAEVGADHPFVAVVGGRLCLRGAPA